MKRVIPILSGLVLSCMGCTNPSYNRSLDTVCSTDSLSNSITPADTIIPFETDTLLLQFKDVIDTLNSIGNHHVHSDYFLHDIAGNGHPELWIISGSCEADKELWVYHISDGTVTKILSDNGGHTDFFLKGNSIGSLTCNTGSGYVSAYTYKNGEIQVESIEYDGWSENEQVKIKNARDRQIADIWENSDSTISLKPLK